jgi:hypothetical protein
VLGRRTSTYHSVVHRDTSRRGGPGTGREEMAPGGTAIGEWQATEAGQGVANGYGSVEVFVLNGLHPVVAAVPSTLLQAV